MANAPLSSGQLARAAGVNVQTLRFYERRGLLPGPSRSAGGHRRFGPEALGLLRLIRRAQELGFTLAEIAELLELRGDPAADCGDVCAVVQAKLDHVERQLARLTEQRRRLRRLRDACPTTRPLRDCPVVAELERGVARRKGGPDEASVGGAGRRRAGGGRVDRAGRGARSRLPEVPAVPVRGGGV